MASDEEPESQDSGGAGAKGSGAMILIGVISILVIVGFLYSTMTR